MNISGNAFRDITDTVLTMDYNTEFSLAAAALAGTKPECVSVNNGSATEEVLWNEVDHRTAEMCKCFMEPGDIRCLDCLNGIILHQVFFVCW